MKPVYLLLFTCSILLSACTDTTENKKTSVETVKDAVKPFSKIPLIFDTDANNELDDQHALAYLLFNGGTFDVLGITVNATFNGGDIKGHYEEAERVLKLCDLDQKIPLIAGANADFEEIKGKLGEMDFDGKEAVDFIIEEARKERSQTLKTKSESSG